MASRSPGPGELVAGASGFLLLLAMLLPWFGVETSARLPGGRAITVGGGDLNAWEAFAGIDVVLVAVAALAIATLAVGLVTEPPPVLWIVLAGAAAAAALLIVYRLIDPPSLALDEAPDTAYETARRLGAFVGLVCTGAMAWGANIAGAVPEPKLAARPAREPRTEPVPAAAAATPPPEPPPARAAAPAASAPVRAPAPGPIGGWTRAAVDAEVGTAWRRHDRRLGARYERYFGDHPELAGEGRGTAADLAAAMPPGWERLADSVPAGGWTRGHLSGKSSQALGVGLLGVAAERDPSLSWLWDAVGPLPPAGDERPAVEFAHVVEPELLGERPRQTSFDVLVDDSNVLIGIETKWREHGIGVCLCRGEGVGPGEGARCSRRVEQRDAYWESADAVLGLGSREAGAPCPISPVYELVRHAAALRALAGPERLAVLALLYDSSNPYFAPSGAWPGWPALIADAVGANADPDDFRFAALAWQELVPVLPLDEPARAWAADKHGLD